MLTRTDLVALFTESFEKAAELSGGKLEVIGTGGRSILLGGGKFATKTVDEYLDLGYFQSWRKFFSEFSEQVIVPLTVAGHKESAGAFIDMYERLGLSVFHRHEENDRHWYAICKSYRMQVAAYSP